MGGLAWVLWVYFGGWHGCYGSIFLGRCCVAAWGCFGRVGGGGMSITVASGLLIRPSRCRWCWSVLCVPPPFWAVCGGGVSAVEPWDSGCCVLDWGGGALGWGDPHGGVSGCCCLGGGTHDSFVGGLGLGGARGTGCLRGGLVTVAQGGRGDTLRVAPGCWRRVGGLGGLCGVGGTGWWACPGGGGGAQGGTGLVPVAQDSLSVPVHQPCPG